ncbi:Xylose isomerase [Bienertia sinuspersici]
MLVTFNILKHWHLLCVASNDELDGTTSLGSTDELWSSPNDLVSEAAKSSSVAVRSANWEFGALGNTSSNIEINSEYLHNENPSVASCYRKADDISPFSQQSIGRHVEQEEYAVGTTDLVEEKVGLGITLKTAIASPVVGENTVSPNKSTTKVKHSLLERIVF